MLTITGRVAEAGNGIAGQQVNVRVGNRTHRVRTNATGAFRLVRRFVRLQRVRVTATAAVPARTGMCGMPSPFPVPCVGETAHFFTATRAINARVR